METDSFEARLAPVWVRAQAGDEAAYAAALALIAGRLRRYFASRLASRPDAVEDLVQETLLALHLRRGTHDGTAPVSNWVHGIAGHKLADYWRRHGRRDALHAPLETIAELADPRAGEEAAPARHDILALMRSLPAAQRAAIALTRLEGLSMAEASARSGVSVAALKVQVHRGLKRLGDLVRMQA